MLERLTCAAAAAAILGGCTPALDWRELPVEDTGLKATFPCKPEQATRPVTLAGREVAMHGLACRSGTSTFAVMAADLGGPMDAALALQQWQAASLATLRAREPRTTSFRPRGALEVAASAQVDAAGLRPDGSTVHSRAAYFAHGRHVFQAIVLSAQVTPELADPFFAGLHFE
jgi:hypothetical protein